MRTHPTRPHGRHEAARPRSHLDRDLLAVVLGDLLLGGLVVVLAVVTALGSP